MIDLFTRDEISVMTTLTSSTEVAVQFLEHVLRIPYFRIDCIRVENLEQILMEFYDQKHMIKKLYINSRRHIETCYLSIASVETYEKYETSINLYYRAES